MIVVRLGLVAALAVVLYGQPKPKDVDGWDKIKWGMTIADARSTYRIDTQPESRDNWMLLQLHPVKMGNVEVGVQVGARTDTAKITSIRLWSFFGAPNSAPNASPQDFDMTPEEFAAATTPDPGTDDVGSSFRFVQVSGAIPEPSTWAMMLLGFAGLGYAGWRKVRQTAVARV